MSDIRADTVSPVVLPRTFGWLHLPATPVGLAVVLCPALGREARWPYRAMRQLARRLAAQGHPTLRFDYPGTGDAPDLLDGEDPLAAWRDSVHEAIGWLRAQTGHTQVALCGLRFGALLAAQIASARSDVAALGLLSPLLSGRICARELRLAAFGGEAEDGPEDGIEVDGMVLPSATLTALATLDLQTLTAAPAPRILILDEGKRAAAFAAHLQALGASTTLQPFPGYPAMMRIATSNEQPHEAFATVCTWMAGLSAPAHAMSLRASRHPLVQPGHHEHLVQFGPDRRLAGTLCQPTAGSDGQPAVLITNTGGESRSGIARYGARLARRLALDGIASLRFDFAGLGDSVLPGDTGGHVYHTDRTQDIQAAITVLMEAGYERLSGVGLCTGAYHLLHAALDGVRFDHLALVNLVTFQWRPGDIVDVPQRALGHPPPPVRALPPPGPATIWDDPPTAIRSVLARGTRLLLLYGPGDAGWGALEANFGPGGQALAAMRGTVLRVEPGIDHTLSRRSMQDRVGDRIVAFLDAAAAGRGQAARTPRYFPVGAGTGIGSPAPAP